jgi:DNA-binding CsgD family transcriptional regulator
MTELNLEALTQRELEVADMVKQGKSTGEIMKALGIARRTVEQHRANISLKLGIRPVPRRNLLKEKLNGK